MHRILFGGRVAPLVLLLLFFSPGAAGAGGKAAPKYVGAEGCQCHRLEKADWERSSHAKAFELLLPGKRKEAKKKAKLDPEKDYSGDRKCIRCHSVGYRAGGFTSIDATPQFAGVGCEACHGPGSDYRVLHGKKPLTFTRREARGMGQRYGSVDASVCKGCHDHKESPFRGTVDEKYRFEHEKALTKTEHFHNYHPLEGTH